MSGTTCYQRNKVILNRVKRYYHDNIEVLREKIRNKYRGLSEEKNRKREYERNRYHRRLEEATIIFIIF